jgi:hypothetical protein
LAAELRWARVRAAGKWLPTAAWLAAITALGAALRLVWLDAIPGGLFFDVAANLFDVLDIFDGARPIWFPRNNGREPLMLYLQAGTSLLWGPTPFAAKAAAALLGILSVPAAYLLGRELAAHLGDRRGRVVGLLTAFLTATLYWHLHFSRLGLRTISMPLFMFLGLGLFLRALRARSLAWAVASGAMLGVAMYTYTAIRLLPLAMLPTALLAMVLYRTRRRLAVVATALAVWVLVTGPLGIYYVKHPAEVEGRAAAVSVLNPEVGGGDPVRAALRGLVATAEATVWRGAESALENLPGRPLLEPVSGAAFLLGTALALVGLVRGPTSFRIAGLLTLLTLGAMALSPALSVNPPGFVRISGMVPPLVALAALGYEAVYHWARGRIDRRLALPGAALVLAVPLVWTSYDYFVVWAPSDVAFRGTMADKAEGAALVRGWLANGERVFLAPLYARDFTYRYLLRDVPVESFDIGQAVVVPGQGATRYAFPPEDAGGIATTAGRLGGRATFAVAPDASGQRPLLATLVLDSPPPTVPVTVAFANGIGLAAAAASPAARPGEPLSLALTWVAREQPSRDYTVFVHGRDSAGQTRFQRDRMPGDGSVPTTRWRVGDRVGDYYSLPLPADLSAGEYRIVIGLYDQATGQRLTVESDPAHPNEVEVARVRVG